MTGSSTVVGVSMLAHGVHTALVLLGLWALAALLLPHVLDRHGRRHAAHLRTSYADAELDAHAVRVAELRAAVAAGSLPTRWVEAVSAGPTASSAPAAPVAPAPPSREPVLGLPLALVAGTAAAGVHAAVIPAHLDEEPLFAAFFLLAAAAQLWWVVALVSRPSTGVLHVGMVLNGAFIALWAVTRVVGLPFGLLPEPHPVGAWDIVGVLWEIAVIASCLRVLRDTPPDHAPARVPGWFSWHPSTRAAVGAAVVVTAFLTAVGAHS